MPSPIYERRAREARLLLDKGCSKSEAARKVGISRNTLNDYLKHKIRPASKITPKLCDIAYMLNSLDQISAAKKLREIRFSYYMISELLKVSRSKVYNWRDSGVFKSIEKEYAG
jgi:predicted transcriptional regulator